MFAQVVREFRGNFEEILGKYRILDGRFVGFKGLIKCLSIKDRPTTSKGISGDHLACARPTFFSQ